MDDMQAIEQRITRELHRRAGESEPVDDAAIFSAITTTQSPRWRIQPLFSATRFVVAGAIVALFGGLLLAGLLTQPVDDLAPAAVSTSPSPNTTEELLSGMVTEEVAPGVYRVVNDGVRDLAAREDPAIAYGDAYRLVVGQDGGVWIVGPDRDFSRLGDPVTHMWTDEPVLVGDEDIEIASDGSVWSANEWRPEGHGKDMHLMAYDGASWTTEGKNPTDGDDLHAWQVEIGPDGTVWALGSGGLYQRGSTGWTRWPTPFGVSFPDRLDISDDGTRWIISSRIWHDKSDWRDGDPTWEVIRPTLEERRGGGAPENDQEAISPGGTVWMHLDGGTSDESVLARLENDEWSAWTEADGVPAHIMTESWFGLAMSAASDGSVWLVSGERSAEGVVCGGLGPDPDRRVSRFDGAVWSHYLDGLCIHALEVTPDGTAWVRARDTGADTDPVELYVIQPEPLAATE